MSDCFVTSPAGSAATVRLVLDAPAVVAVRVLDARGRVLARISDGALVAGSHAWPLDTSRLAAGVYAVRMTADAFAATRRVTVVR